MDQFSKRQIQVIDADNLHDFMLNNFDYFTYSRDSFEPEQREEFDRVHIRATELEKEAATDLGMSVEKWKTMMDAMAKVAIDHVLNEHNRPGFLAQYIKRGSK